MLKWQVLGVLDFQPAKALRNPATGAKHMSLPQGRRASGFTRSSKPYHPVTGYKIVRQKESNETLRKLNRKLRERLFRLDKKNNQGDRQWLGAET